MKIYEIYTDSFDDREGMLACDPFMDDDAVYRYYVDELSGTAYFQDILTADSLKAAIAKMDGALVGYEGKPWWIAYIIECEIDNAGNYIEQKETGLYRVMYNYDEY